MDNHNLALLLTIVGTLCWIFCFWWMYRISVKQSNLLAKLGEQGKRIEKLSRLEHDLIKEVHPQVDKIKAGVSEIVAAVRNTEEKAKDSPKK